MTYRSFSSTAYSMFSVWLREAKEQRRAERLRPKVPAMTYYECQFAPCARTWRDAIRVGQLVRDDGRSVYEAFAPDAFAGWGAKKIPILLLHDETKHAGTVTVVSAHGDWIHASFVLDGPHAAQAAEIIKRSGRVSPGFIPVDKDLSLATPISPAHNPTHWYLRARLLELSLAQPSDLAWYQGAQVTRAFEPPPPPPTAAREEVIIGGPTIRRTFRPPTITIR